MGRSCWHTVGAVVLCAGAAWAQTAAPATSPATQPNWELREGGRWQQLTGPTTAPISDETLDRVEEMIQAKQAAAGKRVVVAWLRTHKDSPIRDRGLYLLGQANFVYGDRIMSFYNFDELLDKYPDSRWYYPALERQYEIADQYLRGYKRRFLMMPILEATEEATEMLYRIQQRAPGSPLAEKALLRAADYYYAKGDFDIAADAYAAYGRSYPKSPVTSRVRLRQAFSSLAQFRGVKFDATPIIDARQQLLDLAAAYPAVADEENIPAIVQRIDLALSRKLLETARFYRKTDKPIASAYHYRLLLATYPNAPEAQIVEHELARLPASARQVAASAISATRPSTNPAVPSNPESR